jgi:hypothetical protein
MLNSEYIHSKIHAPETCISEDAASLKELIELYPYASTFSILYLKSLSNSGDIRLESELDKLAYRINDRSILYNLIHTKEQIIENSEVEIKNNLEENSDVEILKVEQEEIVEESQTISSETELEKHELINTDDQNNRQEDELERLIASAAISSTFVDKELESLPELITEDEVEQKNENPDSIISIDQKPITSSSPKSFTDWLKSSSNSFNEETEDEEENRRPNYYTFEKPKKEFFSPTKKAKESLDENKMPVSETLAKIFALQGNFSKAIYVYEQLILIFPEKKTFFASQIKNLKKKINP